jgi:hypothetical protein
MRRRQADKIFKRYWLTEPPFLHFKWKKKTIDNAISIADLSLIIKRKTEPAK